MMTDKENGISIAVKPVLLYFYPTASSFGVQDTQSFQNDYTVKAFSFLTSNKLKLPLSFIRQKLFLFRNISSAAILVCQFAGYHSMLPVLFAKIFRKSCLVVVGGTDCVSFPDINYGSLRKPLLAWFTLKSLKWATHISAPSTSLIEYEYTYMHTNFPKQGYRYFDPSIKTPCTVIYNGIDTELFKPDANIRRRGNSFLTVVNYIDQRNYLLKGLDLFIEAARNFPYCKFTIIGRLAPGFNIEKPANLNLIDFIPNELLPSKMSEFTFYCQLSVSEGFGVSLAEAMACGCIPIVSKVGIMDIIIGDSGFVLEKYDSVKLKSIIAAALESDNESPALKARQRVVENYNIQIRKTAFKQLMNDLLESGTGK